MKWMWLLVLVSGCAQSYLLQQADLQAAQAGAPLVPARSEDGRAVRLSGAALEGANLDAAGPTRLRARLRPSRDLRISRALFGVAAVLLGGVVITVATIRPNQEVFPQEYSILALGNLAGVFVGAGSVVALGARHEAER